MSSLWFLICAINTIRTDISIIAKVHLRLERFHKCSISIQRINVLKNDMPCSKIIIEVFMRKDYSRWNNRKRANPFDFAYVVTGLEMSEKQ